MFAQVTCSQGALAQLKKALAFSGASLSDVSTHSHSTHPTEEEGHADHDGEPDWRQFVTQEEGPRVHVAFLSLMQKSTASVN